MLVGRARELEQLGSLLDEARLGRAAALLLTGEAGLGKTALLDAAVSSAGDFTVLRARGIESEGEISYAVVSELLGQLPSGLESLPRPLRTALESARALRFASGESAAVTAAWAALLVAASESQPVLVVVDDIQWADGSSAEAVLFAARRVHDARVATLLALRDPPAAGPSADGDRAHRTRAARRRVRTAARRRRGSGDPRDRGREPACPRRARAACAHRRA